MLTEIDTPLEVRSDKEAISRSVAEAIVQLIKTSRNQREYFSIALAGGSTPKMLYRLLATEFASEIPWNKILFFWGDERFVPHDHEKSNYHMAKEALLDHVPIPEAHIFPMPTSTTNPKDAAAAYAIEVKQKLVLTIGRFDLVLLGMGDDGHTASLFPGSPALEESQRIAVAAPAPVEPKQRLTLTYPILNKARNVYFLVAGENKGPALRCVMGQSSDITVCPSRGIQPKDGRLIWWVDEAAAAALDH